MIKAVTKKCTRFDPPKQIIFTIKYLENPRDGVPAISKISCNNINECIGTDCSMVQAEYGKEYWEDIY